MVARREGFGQLMFAPTRMHKHELTDRVLIEVVDTTVSRVTGLRELGISIVLIDLDPG